MDSGAVFAAGLRIVFALWQVDVAILIVGVEVNRFTLVGAGYNLRTRIRWQRRAVRLVLTEGFPQVGAMAAAQQRILVGVVIVVVAVGAVSSGGIAAGVVAS